MSQAQFKRRTSHEIDLTERIKFLLSSTFESDEFVQLNLDRPRHFVHVKVDYGENVDLFMNRA